MFKLCQFCAALPSVELFNLEAIFVDEKWLRFMIWHDEASSRQEFIIVSALAAVALAQNPDAEAQIIASDSEVNPDGSYRWNYETSNGIRAQEEGVGGQSAQGSASWTDRDGTPIQLTYVADVNGFQPQGAHLPREGPAPAHVLKTLEFIRANPPKDDPNFNIQALEAEIARLQSLQ
ncbi:pupal cuticle protein 78E [Culex quinquefasciatus]|uniref:Pupal cuticle protein 78E n=1 Tax=Culex quinquefasciatus TaxID=7176 RepID=B0WPT5_CULQU|nr:pupal cuticle protein 78E [Culex quinquefasciatus]|eukprot:XP_001850719.1 pupal cuticle protein 78E [Culex quinquefasciatus]